jgi:hypothetical protein
MQLKRWNGSKVKQNPISWQSRERGAGFDLAISNPFVLNPVLRHHMLTHATP